MEKRKNIPPGPISFKKDNCKVHFENWNKKNNNALTDWLINGQMIKIEDWLYLNKDYYTKMENELNTYYKVIDLNLIDYNPGLKNDVKFYCTVKEREVKRMIEQYFNDIPYGNYFVMPFYLLCGGIIQQPVYVLDAIEQHPDSPSKELIVYYRHKFIHTKIKFAKDKFNELNIALNKLFNLQLAERKNNKPLLNLFIFTEQFINELTYDRPTGINYFESPLFITFFSSIMGYKNRYTPVWGDISFNNINEIDTKLKTSQPQQTEAKTEQETFETKPVLISEAVQKVFEIMKKFFSTEQQTELKQILETGNQVSNKLLFKGNGNRLTDTFKKLIEHDFIPGCLKQDLINWIISNFNYTNQNKEKSFVYDTVEKIISRNDYPCKSPLIEIINGQIQKVEQPRTKKYSKY